ncbi:type II secretion system protein [Candidatus Margulisiibacteriota bacterium]
MNRKGFTLIEMLVVIGIIGLLAFFLVPHLLGAQDKAKEASVKAVMHSVQLAIEGYNLENNTFPITKATGVATLVKNYLNFGGYMVSIPKNPFTGVEYTDADFAGKIVYDYNDMTGVYVISGYKRDGKTKILDLTNM